MLIFEILMIAMLVSVVVSILVGFCIRVGSEERSSKRFVPQGRANYVNGKWRIG